MAKNEKNAHPPQAELSIPSPLSSIMQAFRADSDTLVSQLIADSIKAIYGKDDLGMSAKPSKAELDGVVALMKGIDPKDTMELLFASQIVVGHLLGMRKLAEGYGDDQRLGLNMLKFSNEAMMNLQKKRSGLVQNITVNYVNSGPGNAYLQANLQQ